MKKILLSLGIVYFISGDLNARGNDSLPYYPNKTMTAFHGTWRWVNGNDTIEIFLTTKKVYNAPENYYMDLLLGWHLYKKGGTIVESSYNSINNVGSETIDLWNFNTPGGLKVEGILTDRPKNNKPGKLTLVLNSQQNQFTWKLENTEGLHYSKPSDPPFDYGFTLPKNLVFTKQ